MNKLMGFFTILISVTHFTLILGHVLSHSESIRNPIQDINFQSMQSMYFNMVIVGKMNCTLSTHTDIPNDLFQ